MIQRKKRLGVWILLLMILIFSQNIVPVKASAPEITDANIQMVGGQIRTITPMGLRMIGCIKKSYLQELEQSGATVQYGIVLLPKVYLGKQELKIDGKYISNGSVYKPAKVPAVKKFAEENDRIYFTAVLANLAKERYKNDYAARAYVEITRSVEQEDGNLKKETEILYSDDTIDRQVYQIAKEAVAGEETEENKQWLRDNILHPVEQPEDIPEEEKKIPFQMGKVSGVTLYHQTGSEAGIEEISHFTVDSFKTEEYLVKVEMEDQPELFAGISKVIVAENNQVSFELKLDHYVTEGANQTKQGAIVEFGTVSEGEASTKYITMQSLIDKIKENPSGTYTLEHDIDASAVQGEDFLIPNFTGTFDGKGYKIKGLNTTLFGVVSGGTVKNVKLENVSITKANKYGDAGGGVLTNKAEKNAVIEGVHVSGSLKTSDSRQLLGGLVGRMDYAKVSKCSTNLEITGSFNTTGGLIGQMSNQQHGPNIVEDSYAVGSISGNKTNGAIGGLIGWHNCKNNFSVTNCYAAVTLKVNGTGNSMEPGGLIGNIGESNATGVIKNSVSYSTGTSGYKFDGASSPDKYNVQGVSDLYSLKESKLKKETARAAQFSKVSEVSIDTLLEKEFYTQMGWREEVWDFTPLKEGKTPVLKNGDSNMTTMLEMKEISSVEELQKMKDDLSGAYSLTADIDLSEVNSNIIIPGTFRGMLKGNGHQIIGQKAPLFETLNGATIENLKLTQGKIEQKSTNQVAVLAKTAEAGTTIKNVYVRDMTVAGKSSVAGMVAVMKKTTVDQCSVNATVNGQNAGGFVAEILDGSVVTNSYAKRTTDQKSFESSNTSQGGFAAVVKKSQLSKNFGELSWSEEKEEAVTAVRNIGNFIGECGTAGEAPTKVEKNISFGPAAYSFVGNITAETALDTYEGNYEYSDVASSQDNVSASEMSGKIDKASSEQISSKEFYLKTLLWDEKIWYLDDVVGGKRPRLQEEGDVYGVEDKPSSEEVIYLEATVQSDVLEEPQEELEKPEEIISAIATRTVEAAAALDSLETSQGYDVQRKQIYENLRLFMPFYHREQIIKDGNQVDVSHVLNKKAVLAVYPMDAQGNRIVALSDKTVENVKKLRIQFTDNTTPLIYNISYIDTRENIASYKVSQIPVHFNFRNYVVNTKTPQFQTLLNTAKNYTFDTDIETRVSQRDSDSVLAVYRRNFDEVVKNEMEQVLVSMAATNPQYPINSNSKAAEKIVTDAFITNEYLKDFLYAYNYVDRWYDFQIGGINLRDVVIFDNSILKTNKSVRNLPTEIVKISSSDGRQGNKTPFFYNNRISSYTGINNVASFVEYFMTAYAGYSDVNDWIIDNFQGGIIVEARANNPKINSRLWRILKNNTVQKNNELILPVLSYKTSKNLYLASFPSSLVYGNLEIYGGYQNTEEWRQQKKQQIISQVNDFKTSYDNFVNVASNGAASVNNSKFLIVDSSANKNHNQDVFKEFYRPLQTLWKSNNGAVAVIFGNPNYDYIYYNSSSFIGDLTVLNHEMGHVTDMWIWMENKGKRPGRNGEDYSNGFANQANVDYNMNFMKTYSRDSSMVTNLTPDRINTQEEFQSYYKEVFETIYTLDYLQGKAYLELTPEQQSRITLQHRYGTTNNYQSWNNSNSTWRTIGAAELESMNLKTLDDLWNNQLTIRPGHRYDLRSFNDVGVNNLGAYQIDRVCFASWYVPYVDNGTPNAQTFRRNGYELAGLYGYSNGLVEYLSNQTKTGDLAYFKKKTGDQNFSFETYRKNKNTEIQEKIAAQKLQGNPYFDEEALIEYLKQNLINYGNSIDSGVSNLNNTLNHIKESRENVFRYLQRITDEFRNPVYGDASTRNVVSISTGEELIEKISANPNGFFVLRNDISMKDIPMNGSVYIDKTFIGKLEGNGHKITDAKGPLFARIVNSYVSDLSVINESGEKKDWIGAQRQYTILVNEKKEETVKEITSLDELKTLGENKYTKYVLKNDIDATSATDTAVIKGTFKGKLDGGNFAITGLKRPLFEKVDDAVITNLKIKDVEISNQGSKNAAITKESNHTTFANLSLENIQITGESYNAAISGYDYTGSTFSKIQIRKAQITGAKNYNAAFVGRASGSDIRDIAVIESKVVLSGTDCGGFIGEGKNLNIHHVYSDSDVHVETYTDNQGRTNSAGFIGNLAGKSKVQYVFAAGTIENKTQTELYNFLGTPNVLDTMVSDAFVRDNAGGKPNITETTGNRLSTVTAEQTKKSEFYRTSMNLNEEIWNLGLVGMKGYPELLGMEKKEIISVSTPEEFMKMKEFPTQEYHLTADINLSDVEQTEVLIPQFSGVLDGKHHIITGLKVPLFGQMNGRVSNLAISNNQLEISKDETGMFADEMTGATVEKVLIYNSKISNTTGKAAGFAKTVNNTTLKNIFVQGSVQASSTASGFVLNANSATVENIYTNVRVSGTEGAGFVVSSTGENTYKNICSVGDVGANMHKLSGDITQIINGYEFAASNGIASASETGSVKNVGKEVWTKDFYMTTLGLDSEVWNAEQADTNGYPSLKDFTVQTEPMKVEINTLGDVQKMNRVPEGKFVLTADLSFEGADNSFVTETFTGTLNGGNHAVSGINSAFFQILSGTVENLQFRNILVNNESSGANVLAVETKNATVKNLHFNGITLRGAGYTGIIGKDTKSTFNQISMQHVDMTANADYAGVMAANASQSQMTDILIAETQVKTSSSYVGGLIGNADAVSIQKTFVDAELNIPYTVSPANTAAFIGLATGESRVAYSTVAGGVYPEDPSTSRYKLMYMKNGSDLNELKPFTNCFINTDTPGYDSVGSDPKGVINEELLTADFYANSMQLNSDVWDWSKVSQNGYPGLKTMPTEGVRAPGTEVKPEEEAPLQQNVPAGYQAIRTAEELLAIRDGSGKYILMNSISLYGKKAQNGSFLGNFRGELDGNGLTIRELYGAPLFDTLSGTVNNLKVSDAKVEVWNSNQGANAIAKTLNGAKISRLALKNILVAGGKNTGALAGSAQNSVVSEVWAEGLNVNPYGPLWGQDSDKMVGGLIAYLNGGCHITDSYVGGEITVNGNTQGGVLGYSEYDTSNTVKQVVSNMRTKAASSQTDGSGFIGMVQFNSDMGTWMENSIAIGEAGADKKQGSIGEAYRFATKGRTDTAISYSLNNCYEIQVSGKSTAVSGSLEETTEYKNPDFYRNTLKFDGAKWNFASVEKNGYPTLTWIVGEEPLPALPQGSEVTEHPLLTSNTTGYTEIRTPADFMKIADNPRGKYILMNNISMEQVRIPEGQASYIMNRFEGELDGNNQVIHGLRVSLFDSISGTTRQKATVKNLRIQNVFVDAGMKTEYGFTRRGEANALAREISYGNLNSIYMNCVQLNGGMNTAALGGLVNETYIGKVWLEGIDINRKIDPTELAGFNLVGGAIASLSGYNSKLEDSYVSGNIIMDNNEQGGAVGKINAAVVRNVITNVEARSNKPATWSEKSGFLGAVSTMGTYGTRWYLDRCISIGNAGDNYKFLGRNLTAVTTDNVNKCYEYTKVTGKSNVSDNTISRGTLLTTDNIHDIAFYRDTLSFNDDTAGADTRAWDFSSVETKGYPTLTWLLTYDGLEATLVDEPLPEEGEELEDQDASEEIAEEEAAPEEENPQEEPETILPEEQPALPEQEDNLPEGTEENQPETNQGEESTAPPAENTHENTQEEENIT